MNNSDFSPSQNQAAGPMPTQSQPIISKKGNAPFWVAIAFVIVACGLLLWYLMGVSFDDYLSPINLQKNDNQAVTETQDVKELGDLDLGNLDAEFDNIDADLNSL